MKKTLLIIIQIDTDQFLLHGNIGP